MNVKSAFFGISVTAFLVASLAPSPSGHAASSTPGEYGAAAARKPQYLSPGIYVEEVAPKSCKSDADCKGLTLYCTENFCDFSAANPDSSHIGTCNTRPLANCRPCAKYVEAKDKPGYICCEMGFDGTLHKDEFACCKKYVEMKRTGSLATKDPFVSQLGEKDPGMSYASLADYKDIYKWIFRECLYTCKPPEPLDCNIFKDAATRTCCVDYGNHPPAMVIKQCVKPGECSNAINITAGAGATVDLSNFNQCCQVVTNTGTMTDTTISQACGNLTPPPPGGGPGTGTTTGTEPSGSPTAASCECTPADPKARQGDETVSMVALGKPTPFTCQYNAPAVDGPLALTSAAKLFVQADGPFTTMDPASAPAGADLKTASLPTASNTFTVWAPLLQSWQDNPDYRGMVKASALAVDGTTLSSADCPVVAKLGVQGGGSVSGGCSLIREAAAQPATSDPCLKYGKTDPAGYRCCRMGLDEAADSEEFKCCRKYVESGIRDLGTKNTYELSKGTLVDSRTSALDGMEELNLSRAGAYGASAGSWVHHFFRWMYQYCLNECPPQPRLDCRIFRDDETRACCANFADIPAMAIKECVKPGECSNAITIVAGEGATVNLDNFNQCCQAVTNTGAMTGVNISQVCGAITPPPAGSAGTGTATAGASGAVTAPAGSTTPTPTPTSSDDGGGCALIPLIPINPMIRHP